MQTAASGVAEHRKPTESVHWNAWQCDGVLGDNSNVTPSAVTEMFHEAEQSHPGKQQPM